MTAPSRSRMRGLLVTVLKAGVGCVILWWLLREVDIKALRQLLVGASVPLLLVGLALNLATVLIAGLRWQWLVRAVGLPMRWRELTCIAFVGQFFATFLPGPLGDDITRMVYISRLAGEKTPLALSSVLLDRLIGLSVILLLALAVWPWHPGLLHSNPQTALLATGLVAGGLAVCLAAAVFFLLPRTWLHQVSLRLMTLLPAGALRTQAGRFAGAYLDHRQAIARVAGLAFVTQMLLCGMFWVAGAAVGIQLPAQVWFGFVPVVLAANAVPVTIAGLGVREYLLVLFLGVLGNIPPELALAASLAAFSIMLSTNMIGGLVYVFFKSRPPALRFDGRAEISP